MPFTLDFARPVKQFFRGLTGVSRQARIRVFVNLHSALANIPDAFRNDQANRVPPGDSEFLFQLLLRDDDGDGRIHRFDFVVNDTAAPYGVLRIIEARHARGS